jgi:hypothetical protein
MGDMDPADVGALVDGRIPDAFHQVIPRLT